MQPRQSDKPSASSKPATATTAATTATTTPTTTDLRPKVKVIKSKRPLCHFKFYLDICDHQLAKRVEQDIKSLGGQLEFFLSDSITHFITDKPQLQQAQQQQGQTPQPHTPLTPNQSPLHQPQLQQQDEVRKTRQSRADAILSRVRRQTSVGGGLAAAGTGGTVVALSGSPVKRSYIVWQTDYAQRFFKRIQTELKAYLEGAGAGGSGTGSAAAGSIHLKGQFVKIESIKRNYRPYYHLIKQPEDWPKLQLDSDDGAFRLQEKRRRSKSLQSGMTTRKSTEDQQQQLNNKAAGAGADITKKKPQEDNIIKEKESSDKQCGVCEICKLEYDTLSLHLQSKDHELFAKNPENFLALDSLIQTSANVKEFLLELNDLNEMEEQLNSSSGSKSSPALREKSKRITKGKHSSEKFASPPATKQINSPALVASSLNGGGAAPAIAAASATTTPSRRSKVVVQNSGLSPPIRAMLPPSSLYKVVEAIPRDDCSNTTPLRRGRAANNQNVDSPSLIVKFQKVRQSELQRLNGEAENFMFPRTTAAAVASAAATTTRRKSSSELATDIDRQTTSDIRGRHSISSASLDTTSTSEAEIASGGAGAGAVIPTAAAASVGGRAQLVARRRKLGNQQQHQRFPKAPIQPEVELKQEQRQLQEDILVVATRKSSRMATAIVTAATTSNQLQLRQTNTRKTKLEDRMGDNNNSSSIQTPTKTKNKREVNKKRKAEEQRQAAAAADIGDNEEEAALDGEVEIEEEEQEDEESSCCPSSGSDEDYVANRRRRGRQTKQTKAAARRQSRLTINRNSLANKSSMNPNNTINQDQIFDCSKSERLTKMRYTFESLPTGELWHRVFNRQDRGEEEYYTYYGSTQYRKLPYEMGPIPMIKTTQLGKHKCCLCPPEAEAEKPEEEVVNEPQEDIKVQRKETLKMKKGDDVETIVKKEHLDELPTASTINTTTITSSSSSSSLYKHKKLHLLQRYQQEQQLQQQQQQQCDSKASTPELLEREFGSLGPLGAISRVNRVRSSSSSSCSNSQKSVNTCRNKQLARLTELPPRKSPREHASTLALVSCIIRQRQDSQNSKTNSEAEDPPPPPIKMKTPPPRGSGSVKKEPDIVDVVVASSPRTTRSQAATPIEELRFATEISETVKRMRRGQNKYDHSPPAPAPATAPPLARRQRPNNNCYSRRLQFSSASVATTNSARRRPPRSSAAAAAARSSQSTNHLSFGMGIRKLPSKKGLLEYEMEPCAMKALDASMQYRSPHLMAWQIDKYLELVGKEYDFNDNDNDNDDEVDRLEEVVTPPPTDCNFTSEFDLCDLLQGGSAGSGDDDPDSSSATPLGGGGSRRLSSTFSLYSSYYRKRKSLKSNRTGWPKAQRRRHGGGGSRHLAASNQRICFKEMGLNEISTAIVVKQEPLEAPPSQTTETTNAGEVEVERSAGDAVVMTPPATDVEPIEAESLPDAGDDDDADDDGDEDDDDDDEEEADEEAEIEATDADVEEEEEEEEEDVYEDAFEEPSRDLATPPPKEQQKLPNVDQEPPQKRSKLISSSTTTTPTNANAAATTPTKADSGKKLLLTLHNGQRLTSTPSSTHHHQPQQPQQQQRLNGSLGSCISPSEKLGDNSDIFTVSSDGLDTDLDLSNHQAECPHQQQQTTSPPKRKFDISKYAPPNNGKAASSCAAEAATAAVKSLAISQFLKKEVRVTCRRLRAPFRRFRYRR